MKSMYLKEGQVIPLTFDKMFKKVFGDVNDTKPIKYLIKQILDLDVEEIEIYNNELLGERYVDKKNEVDLIFKRDNKEVINIEINTNFGKTVINRNLLYLCRVVSRNLKSKDKYSKLNRHIQIKFNANGGKKDPFRIYQLINKNNIKDVLTDLITIYEISIPYYLDMCYTKDEKKLSKKEKIIGIIGCREKSVYTKLIGDDDIMKDIENKVRNYSEDDEIVGLYDREAYEKELAEIEKKEAMKEAREKGHKQGLQEGVEQGIEKGIEQGVLQEKQKIAKNMLKKNIDINFIAEIVGLNVTEISNL